MTLPVAGPAPRCSCSCPSLVAVYVWALRRRRPIGRRATPACRLRPRRAAALVAPAAPPAVRAVRRWPSAALVVALARPVAILSVPANQTTIILAIDVSGSMCSTDIAPTRLAGRRGRGRRVHRAARARGTQIGIVAFSGFAEIVQPPTTDQQAPARRAREPDDRAADGDRQRHPGRDRRDRRDRPERRAERRPTDRPGVAPPPVPPGAYAPDIIVLLTDGASNAGPTPVDAAQQAADRGLRVYTIGFGTAERRRARPELCRRSSSAASRAAAAGSAAAGSAAAAAASGAGSTRTTLTAGRRR